MEKVELVEKDKVLEILRKQTSGHWRGIPAYDGNIQFAIDSVKRLEAVNPLHAAGLRECHECAWSRVIETPYNPKTRICCNPNSQFYKREMQENDPCNRWETHEE